RRIARNLGAVDAARGDLEPIRPGAAQRTSQVEAQSQAERVKSGTKIGASSRNTDPHRRRIVHHVNGCTCKPPSYRKSVLKKSNGVRINGERLFCLASFACVK